MVGNRWSLMVGMGIPALAVVVGILVASQSTNTILGIPMVFAWLFAMLPVTTLCFWFSWRFLERDAYELLEGDEK